MQTKSITLALTVVLVSLVILPFTVIQSPKVEAAMIPKATMPLLGSFAIRIQEAALDSHAEEGIIAPRAVVAVKVQLTNSGMEEKRDVLLRVALQDANNQVVSESSMLVYVPYQKTNTYTVSILTRESGVLSVVAEVVSQGKAVSAEPSGIGISLLDLIM